MSSKENGFGTGFYYDENFDWTVNAVGDVGSSTGIQKLASALSYFLVNGLQQYLGTALGLGEQEDARKDAFAIINRDERIEEVLSVSTRADIDQGVLYIETTVDTILEDEEIDFTFPVTEQQ